MTIVSNGSSVGGETTMRERGTHVDEVQLEKGRNSDAAELYQSGVVLLGARVALTC